MHLAQTPFDRLVQLGMRERSLIGCDWIMKALDHLRPFAVLFLQPNDGWENSSSAPVCDSGT